jgi:putative glycosyl hydrolase-like family 15 (GHL15) protein
VTAVDHESSAPSFPPAGDRVALMLLLGVSTLLVSCERHFSGRIAPGNAERSSVVAGDPPASAALLKRIAAVRGTGFPRRAALVVGDHNLGAAAERALIARFDLAMLGLYAGWSQNGLSIQAAAQALKTLKPSILVGNYSVLNEAYYNTHPDARTTKLSATNWWLRDAAGKMVQWTSSYGAWDVNITAWAAPDANGQRYPQWVADWFDSQYFAGSTAFDIWYFDNVMVRPRDPPADWKLNATNQESTDADVASAFRAGQAAEWAEARKLEPDMLLLGNADSDLSSVEYKGRLNLALLECLTGQSWSIETWGGWAQMMRRYLGVTANLAAPQVAVFSACGGATDYALFRYSLASALMGDGYFAYNGNASYSSASWYDEFNVNLGAALQPAVTAAYQKGVYRRDFQNGIVLVNPRDNGTRTITLGGTFRKILGTQDPATNNGQAVTAVTLNAADGLVLTR